MLDQLSKDTLKGRAINELQSLQAIVVAGGGAGADLTATGLKVADSTLAAVLRYVAGVPTANLLDEASVTADNTLVCATTNTTGNVLVVWFWNKPTPR